MITAAIAHVFPRLKMAAWDEAHGAVGATRVMNGNPHADTKTRIGGLEIGIIRMPIGASAVLGGLEENLVEVLHGLSAQQRGDRLGHTTAPGQARDQPAVGNADRTDLQIENAVGMGDPIAFGDDIAQLAVGLQVGDFGLQGSHLSGIEEIRYDHEPFTLEVGKFGGFEGAHGIILAPRMDRRQPQRKNLSPKRNFTQLVAVLARRD